jgi:5-methylcytosine-specific restriction endonuclease McrA
MNKPLNPKERNLIKGALRRVFSRSELRRSALEACRIEHSDLKRPRVTKWGICSSCNVPTALYQMEVDHVIPLVPLDKELVDMSWDEVVDRLWCEISNLKPICKPCHKIKSKAESKIRRDLKKAKKSIDKAA